MTLQAIVGVSSLTQILNLIALVETRTRAMVLAPTTGENQINHSSDKGYDECYLSKPIDQPPPPSAPPPVEDST